MQHLSFKILVFLFALKSFTAGATIPVLPEDFHGVNTEKYISSLIEDEDYVPSMLQTGGIMFELGKYYNDKYPAGEIFDEDFEDTLIEDLRRFFPDENNSELRERLSLLRSSVKLYRSGMKAYDEYVSQKIAPAVERKVHSPKDYDQPDEFSYISVPEGEFAKIYNFKKFLSYSSDPKEREAIHKYERESADELSIFDKIDYMYQRFEWKKFPEYGITKKNPLLSDLGIGAWQKGKNADARLLSPQTYTENKEKLYVGVHLITRLGYFILANNLDEKRHKPYISLTGSENIKNYEVLYPISLQSRDSYYVQKYYGDFIIPIEINLNDTNNPLKINATIDLWTCDSNIDCSEEKFEVALDLAPKGKDFLPNGFENFFNMSMQTVPEETSPEFSLKKAVVDIDGKKQALRLEFKTEKKVRNFKVFVEQVDGYAKFEAPLLSVRDGIIYARLNQLAGADYVDLKNKNFIISAELNHKTSLRSTVVAKESSPFDAQQQKLSVGILLLAFIGGVILNFMPCVFPVLSLKILALSRTPPRKRKNLKKALRQTVCGILFGFALIILLLCLAKYLGNTLGWGMQFQNMEFLVMMVFVIAVFIIILPYLDFDNLYRHTINIPLKSLNYGIGFLTVMMATPCTGPYMATAVGFALSGTYLDLILTLSALALGLCTPYIIILFLPKPDELFPKSGEWLNILKLAMSFLLYATLVWFLFLIWKQTNRQIPLILIASIFLFMFCFKFYLRLLDYLGKIIDEQVNEKSLQKAKNIASAVMIIIFFALLVLNITQASSAYNKMREHNLATRLTGINKNLIAEKLAEGKSVLLEIKADWCLTCQYNGAVVLTDSTLENWKKLYNLELMTVDWTDYNRDVLDFMEKYGRKGLPFYVLFTPILRDGIVLPEMFSADDVTAMLINSYQP